MEAVFKLFRRRAMIERKLTFQSLFSWKLFSNTMRCKCGRETGEVSILVFMEAVFKLEGQAIYTQLKTQFQSLFSWKLFSNRQCLDRHPAIYEFQSLFSWKLFSNPTVQICRCACVRVSILVFMEAVFKPLYAFPL